MREAMRCAMQGGPYAGRVITVSPDVLEIKLQEPERRSVCASARPSAEVDTCRRFQEHVYRRRGTSATFDYVEG